METMTSKIEALRRFSYVYKELQKIAKQLHKNDENECNYGVTNRTEAKDERLMAKAQELAESVDLYAYHQTDPRGCSLYLLEPGMDENRYTDGIAVI